MSTTRGAWSSDQTRRVILDAACDCLWDRARTDHVDVRIDVTDVLSRANALWDGQYGADPRFQRILTRGSITTQWNTLEDLEEQALLTWFSDHLVRTPNIDALTVGILLAASEEDHRERRRRSRGIFADFVTAAVRGGNDRAEWTLRYLALRRRDSPRFQQKLQFGYAARRRALLPAYEFAVHSAGWSIAPIDLLDMHLSVIDGSLLQLSSNRTKHGVKVALLAGATADLICRGLKTRKPKIDARRKELLRVGAVEECDLDAVKA